MATVSRCDSCGLTRREHSAPSQCVEDLRKVVLALVGALEGCKKVVDPGLVEALFLAHLQFDLEGVGDGKALAYASILNAYAIMDGREVPYENVTLPALSWAS